MTTSCRRAGVAAVLGLVVSLSAASFAQAAASSTDMPDGTRFRVRNLVSDNRNANPALHKDAHLVNAWGLAFGQGTAAWVADNGTGVSTVYDGNGNALPPMHPLVVTIPGGAPTGLVANPTDLFKVGKGGTRGVSLFLFSSEAGKISGWSPAVDPTSAVVGFSASNTIYKGLALARAGGTAFLYATDFHDAKIDVFDGAFNLVHPPGGFVDPNIPSGFAPFGIRNLGGNLYVTFAKQDADRVDDVHGPHLGFVDVFDPTGHLLHRLVSRGLLNAPWGLAVAPASFGHFGRALLVGNFGDGTINAYSPTSGEFRGTLRKVNRSKIVIDGLWGLSFGNGVDAQPTGTLFFTAGPNDEAHGLFGRIDRVRGL
jgi:uncharacterized protein (TIGR03118 family)